MSIRFRIDPEHLRRVAEKIQQQANELAPRTCSCPHASTHGHLGGCQLDTNPHYAGGGRYAVGGPVSRGTTVYLNEYSDYRIAPGRTTVVSSLEPANAKHGDTWIDSTTGEAHVFQVPGMPPTCQHPDPQPVELTTGEVVAGVCPDCLQPLPPASVGSEWKP